MRATDRALVLPRAAAWKLADLIPALIIIGAVCFNFMLCIINTNFFPTSNAHIIFCEVVLNAAATVYGFSKIDHARLYWLGVMLMQIAWLSVLSIVRHELLFEPIRDVIIMPIFFVLGLSSAKVNVNKMLIGIGLFVLLVALLEAFFVEDFLRFANFRQYFEAKGKINLNRPNYLHLDLFTNGVRPGTAGYLFHIPGLHRLSSVFLEPVSLGFFGFILGLYFVATKPVLKRSVYYSGMLIAFVLILLSDARMAFGSLVLMMVARPLFVRLDHRLSVLFFPTLFVLGLLIYQTNFISHSGEGIGARMYWTMTVLSGTNLELLLGTEPFKLFMGDSALATLLGTQGLFGFLVYWLAPIFFARRLSPEGRVYLYGLAVFLSFGFMLSAAIFSIKSAALLWFLYGYLIVHFQDAGDNPRNYA